MTTGDFCRLTKYNIYPRKCVFCKDRRKMRHKAPNKCLRDITTYYSQGCKSQWLQIVCIVSHTSSKRMEKTLYLFFLLVPANMQLRKCFVLRGHTAFHSLCSCPWHTAVWKWNWKGKEQVILFSRIPGLSSPQECQFWLFQLPAACGWWGSLSGNTWCVFHWLD